MEKLIRSLVFTASMFGMVASANADGGYVTFGVKDVTTFVFAINHAVSYFQITSDGTGDGPCNGVEGHFNFSITEDDLTQSYALILETLRLDRQMAVQAMASGLKLKVLVNDPNVCGNADGYYIPVVSLVKG